MNRKATAQAGPRHHYYIRESLDIYRSLTFGLLEELYVTLLCYRSTRLAVWSFFICYPFEAVD